MHQVGVRMLSGQAQQLLQDKLQDINWDNVLDMEVAIRMLMQLVAEKVFGRDALETQQQYPKETMMLHEQSVKESIKLLFFINNLSVYLEEDVEIISVKQMCKEVLYKNIPGMTRFEFIKKSGKKLINCNEVINLIQDIEALDSISKRVLQEDKEQHHKHEEKTNNTNRKSEDTNNKHSNNHGCQNKPSEAGTENGNPNNKPCRCPGHDHKRQDGHNNLHNKNIKKDDKETKDNKS